MSGFRLEELLIATIAGMLDGCRHVAVGAASPIPGAAALLARARSGERVRISILGSEAHGLSDVWQGDDVQAIRLPMRGSVDSLNVSATAAVLFYEALRQRSAVG